MKKALEAAKKIKNIFSDKIEIAVIGGSGIRLLDNYNPIVEIPYGEIPNFPIPTVKGHEGKLKIYSINSKNIAIFAGRIHYYEGYSPWDITFPIRLIYALSIDKILITNAAGSLTRDILPGDLVIIEDYINFAQINPMIGHKLNFGEQFIPMDEPFDKKFIEIAEDIFHKIKLPVKKGTYIYLTGPAYETKAEVKMLSHFGELVGMSTVPEIIMAKRLGIRVLGISMCTNQATGLSNVKLNHNDVIKIGIKSEKKLNDFLIHFIKNET